MIKSVEEYLNQLKKELAGCDRATVQDAVSDAEEYLRTALSSAHQEDPESPEADLLAVIIEEYGAPDEIAQAYREIESRFRPALASPARPARQSAIAGFFGVLADPGAWGALIYLLFFSMFAGIVYFTWVVTGLSLSLGMIILIVGLPLFALFILSVRGISLVEGRIVEALLGVRMPRRQVFSGRESSLSKRFLAMMTDRYTWLSIIYMILEMPLGIIYFTLFVTLISVSLWGIAIPIVQYGFGTPIFWIYNVGYYLPVWLMPLTVIGGVLLAIATMHLAKAIGQMHGALAKVMLVRI